MENKIIMGITTNDFNDIFVVDSQGGVYKWEELESQWKKVTKDVFPKE